ncbi:MAG: polyamine aminopropyltransferase [Roseibium sp.]|uniref:polyamine aminopropyltransferase n=1 Tax=Roseibium sp. TaxID=1936156 RepID=UPI001B1316E4|nr:polyamine aminopropyltransferase [Roseibium sp.]MBO6894909.1 polyamine aminopropyltransferase [Roseibium sp.]MBO6930312.1 polyamine aminopropyltransferase [Roseibium sp.]
MTAGLKFNETLYPGVEVSYSCDEILYQEKTEHQDLVLFTNPVFGKVLMLDGVTQVTTKDEFIYHEMMSHVPILAHGSAKTVLIVGGGDCGLAEEVLKHPTVERLVQVEIDASVVDFSKEHFGDFNEGVLDDARFELVIADGMKFAAETDRRFDVVIVDSTDPHGPGEVLFSEEFYRNVHRMLTPGGVLVTQNGVPFLQKDELVTSIERFSRIFKDAAAYIAAIPTYFGGHMTLGWASDNPDLRRQAASLLEERFKAAGFETQYYTPDVHAAAFALPKFILDAVEEGRAKA